MKRKDKKMMNSLCVTKRNCIEISVKGLMLAVVVVIACILSAIALYMVNRGKSTINSGNNQYSALMSEFSQLDKAMYDGLEVSGDEVINLIDTLMSDPAVTVRVQTRAQKVLGGVSMTTYCSGTTKDIDSKGNASSFTGTRLKSDSAYINPSASFKGSVEMNDNGIVTAINFVQQ